MTVDSLADKGTFGVWAAALRGIPRLGEEQWRKLDLVARWLIATRAAVLVMTFLSAAIAGILAIRARQFDLARWSIMTIGLLMAHATNNLINDLTDHWTGVDRDNPFRTQYGPQPVENGFVTVGQQILMAAVTGVAALACGIYLVSVTDRLTLLLMAIGVACVLFYTWPLKHIGLGEPVVLLVWGPMMVGGGYYVITEQWSWDVVVASLVYGLGVTAVLFGKHIDKIPFDTKINVRTLPVLLGERKARWVVRGMLVAQYLAVGYLVAAGALGWPLLLVIFALPRLRMVWQTFSEPKPEERPESYPASAWPLYFVSFAFVHNRRFGSLFLLGLVIDAAWILY